MAPLAVLAVASLLLRALGRLRIPALGTWRAAARGGAAAMFTFTGITHFSSMQGDYVAMMPVAVPERAREPLVRAAGALQLAGAAGLLVARLRRMAGLGLCALLAAMFPANVAAARRGVLFRGRPATPLWQRGPVQLVYVAVVWWSAVVPPARRSSRVWWRRGR